MEAASARGRKRGLPRGWLVRSDVPNCVEGNARTTHGGRTSYQTTIDGGHDTVPKRQQSAANTRNVSKSTMWGTVYLLYEWCEKTDHNFGRDQKGKKGDKHFSGKLPSNTANLLRSNFRGYSTRSPRGSSSTRVRVRVNSKQNGFQRLLWQRATSTVSSNTSVGRRASTYSSDFSVSGRASPF